MSQNGFNGFEDRFGFHHHAAPASVGSVVGGMVFVMRIVADVVDAYADQSPLGGTLENAQFKVRRENFRQKCKNLELHGWIVA